MDELENFDFNGAEALRGATEGLPGGDLGVDRWLPKLMDFFTNIGKTTQDKLGEIATDAGTKAEAALDGAIEATNNGTELPDMASVAEGAGDIAQGAGEIAGNVTGDVVEQVVRSEAADQVQGLADTATGAISAATDTAQAAGEAVDASLAPVGGFDAVIQYITHNGLPGLLLGNCSPSDVIVNAFESTVSLAIYILIVVLLANGVRWLLKFALGKISGGKILEMIEVWATYPGVVYHELSHALFALLSGAKVSEIHLFPESKTKMVQGKATKTRTLGYVKYCPQGSVRKRAFQSAVSAIAPSVMGTVGILLLIYFAGSHFSEIPVWGWILWFYAVICVGLHSAMSKTDIENFAKGALGCAITVFAVFMIVPVNVDAVWAVIQNLFVSIV